MIGAVFATASCSATKSDTLGQFGDYRKVEGPWRERTDPLEGPNKFLSYDIWSDDKRATLSLGCFAKQFTTAVSMNGAGRMAVNTKAVVGLRRDEKSAGELFVVVGGETDLRPGLGTSEDAHRFIKSLRGTNRLDFELRSLMGIATTDLPLGFDVEGAEGVAHNLDVACKKAG